MEYQRLYRRLTTGRCEENIWYQQRESNNNTIKQHTQNFSIIYIVLRCCNMLLEDDLLGPKRVVSYV